MRKLVLTVLVVLIGSSTHAEAQTLRPQTVTTTGYVCKVSLEKPKAPLVWRPGGRHGQHGGVEFDVMTKPDCKSSGGGYRTTLHSAGTKGNPAVSVGTIFTKAQLRWHFLALQRAMYARKPIKLTISNLKVYHGTPKNLWLADQFWAVSRVVYLP